MTPWFVYLLACADGSLYAGVTTDPVRRLREHQRGIGARYTRARGAVELVWLLEAVDQSEALRLEAAVKRLPRRAKLLLGNADDQPVGRAASPSRMRVESCSGMSIGSPMSSPRKRP